MTSFGDTTEQLNVYLPWELKDAAGNNLDRAGRMKAFEEWVSRMLVRHALWSKDGPVSYTHLRAHETGRNVLCRDKL